MDWLHTDLCFWRKKQPAPTKPKVLPIPEDNVLAVLTALDEISRVTDGATRVAKYHLWTLLEGIHPETATGNWRVAVEGAMTVNLVEEP